MLVLKTAPTVDPVTVDEAKAHLRIDTPDDDTLIGTLISAVRGLGESITKRAFMTQTWYLYLDEFPDAILVPLPPLASVTSIKYVDADGATQTLDATEYQIVKGDPGEIVPADGKSWPSVRDQRDAITIEFVAGYASAAAVPEEIKAWIKIRVATLYENREAVVVGQTVAEIPRDFIDGLLDQYIVILFR